MERDGGRVEKKLKGNKIIERKRGIVFIKNIERDEIIEKKVEGRGNERRIKNGGREVGQNGKK